MSNATRPPVRQKKFSKTVAVSMTRFMYLTVCMLARRHGLPKSVMLRMMIIWALDNGHRRMTEKAQRWLDTQATRKWDHEIYFVCTRETLDLLDEYANISGLSRAQMCRIMVIRYLTDMKVYGYHPER